MHAWQNEHHVAQVYPVPSPESRYSSEVTHQLIFYHPDVEVSVTMRRCTKRRFILSAYFSPHASLESHISLGRCPSLWLRRLNVTRLCVCGCPIIQDPVFDCHHFSCTPFFRSNPWVGFDLGKHSFSNIPHQFVTVGLVISIARVFPRYQIFQFVHPCHMRAFWSDRIPDYVYDRILRWRTWRWAWKLLLRMRLRYYHR